MVVEHLVEKRRLKRRYFLLMHYVSGLKYGLHEMQEHPRTLFGVPLFLFAKAAKLGLRALGKWLTGDPARIRHTMNFTHACGMIAGCHRRRWQQT
jgi:hypothetical protein